MITLEEALATIEELLKPERLSLIQELVFRQCWQGKTYQDIAKNSGYDHDYIRVVGSRLWQLLSRILDEKITKNNFRSVIRERLRFINSNHSFSCEFTALELPTTPIPLSSRFYIERPPLESQACQEIMKPGALICLRGARLMGKTSLSLKILAHADNQAYQTARISFSQGDETIFSDLNLLLRWFCANLTLQLRQSAKLNDFWCQDLGAKVSCTNYLREYILENSESSLVIILDDLNYLLAYPKTAREFLPLIRYWHEEAFYEETWQKLRLVLVHSNTVYIPLELHQSPFSVGFTVQLLDFDRRQTVELAQRYSLDWYEQDEEQLIFLQELIDGHPYLLNKTFYHLSERNDSLKNIVQQAATETSIYGDFLRSYLITLYQNPKLAQAYLQIITSCEPVVLESLTAYQLENLGLIRLQGNEAIVSYELYRRYFRDRLEV